MTTLSANDVQQALPAGVEGREVGHVLRIEVADLSVHDGILARARLVVAQRLHQVVVVLSGEPRKVRTRGSVPVITVTRGAGLGLLPARGRVARGKRLRAQA